MVVLLVVVVVVELVVVSCLVRGQNSKINMPSGLSLLVLSVGLGFVFAVCFVCFVCF